MYTGNACTGRKRNRHGHVLLCVLFVYKLVCTVHCTCMRNAIYTYIVHFFSHPVSLSHTHTHTHTHTHIHTHTHTHTHTNTNTHTQTHTHTCTLYSLPFSFSLLPSLLYKPPFILFLTFCTKYAATLVKSLNLTIVWLALEPYSLCTMEMMKLGNPPEEAVSVISYIS